MMDKRANDLSDTVSEHETDIDFDFDAQIETQDGIKKHLNDLEQSEDSSNDEDRRSP